MACLLDDREVAGARDAALRQQILYLDSHGVRAALESAGIDRKVVERYGAGGDVALVAERNAAVAARRASDRSPHTADDRGSEACQRAGPIALLDRDRHAIATRAAFRRERVRLPQQRQRLVAAQHARHGEDAKLRPSAARRARLRLD